MIDNQSVSAMCGIAQERVESRTLLAHVGHERIRESVVGVARDAHGWGRIRSSANAIAARCANRREVEPIGLGAWAKAAIACCCCWAKNDLAACVLVGEATDIHRGER